MSDLSVGIVGMGAFGQRYTAALAQTSGVRVRWAIDPDPARRAEARERFGVERVSGSVDDLCADPEVTAAIVVTPEAAHREPTVKALTAGKHVLVEKPLATSAEDAEAMVSAAEASGRLLTPAMLLRFDRRYAQIRERLDGLGTVRSVHAWRNFDRGLFRQYSRTHSFVENAIHDIDLIQWYVDRPLERAHGFCRNTLGLENPDVNWGVLEFSGGAIAVLETNWLYPPQPHAELQWNAGIQVMADGGVLEARNDGTGLMANTEASGLRLLDQSAWASVHGEPRGAFGAMLRHMVSVWRGERAYGGTTARQAAEAMRIADALIADARSRENER